MRERREEKGREVEKVEKRRERSERREQKGREVEKGEKRKGER